MTEAPRDAQELFDPEARAPDGTEAFLDTPQKTNDPVALKKKALSDKNKELKQDADLRQVLSTQQGIRFVARILSACGWNSEYYFPNNSFMCQVAGRRSIGLQVENWISDADLELWFKVRRELEIERPKPKTSKSGAA